MRQAIFWCFTTALEVEQSEDHAPEVDGNLHDKTPNVMEAGYRSGDSQAWQR
jgi:hypothetical protein